jgi:hypothetical protein
MSTITTTIPTHAEVAAMSPHEHKALENQLRGEAKRKGLLLRRSRARDQERWPDEYGLYVLIGDCAGNRRPGAAAAPAAFRNGWGGDLADIARELDGLPVIW